MTRWIFAVKLLLMALLFGAVPNVARAQDDADEAREQKIIERFLTVLERNPRRGTALDRIYGFHVERGTLDKLVETYRQRTAQDVADGAAWMILGLLESQRGCDAAAVAAYQTAEKAEVKNYLAPYYLGQSLVLVGQPEAAAAAFERAIERKPPPAELLEVFQALGRVYQRAQRNEQALAVWARLEKLFPDDARVQEQIASTLAEEGQHAEALTRYQKLAQSTKDRYRQSLFRMEAGELQLKLGQTAEALAAFEAMLGELNPDSWLYREVRRRIEEAFLRNDDRAGLAKYYAGWLEKHADDVDAMARLAHALATQGRVPEAQTWLEKAIKLAPSRKQLRLTFIEQLVYDQRWPEAIAQYEALDKSDPDNPDYLRDWGQLILRDKTRDEAERKQAATGVWRRLASSRPKDPLAATQAADLFRHAEMTEEALQLYRRAVELDPDSAQYREYLGEYYHALKRSDEALAAWREIAAGRNRNAKNLTRLAEVLSGFGYLKEAVETMGQACELENDDFSRLLAYAELLGQDGKFDKSLTELEAAEKLAQNDEEHEGVLNQQIKVYEAAERLPAEIDSLSQRLESNGAGAGDWYRLARLQEAARQLPEATAAINKSLELDGKSALALGAAARIEEAAGNLLDAAHTYRKLAAVDRRSRTLYLTEVAKLEARLGRRDAALAAGRDLLAAAPGNPEHYEFFAELCFQLGKSEEGLETLRRSLRANPSDPQVLLTLARALADRFRTEEAIALYWRAFEKASELEPKLDIVSRLADLYLQTNQFDRLLERLERERREARESRELSICVAQAYHAAGDYGTAGQELVRLLAQNPSDTQLLQQLSTLLESEGDLAEAAKYQQQLVRLAPGKETETRLAMLLARAGQTEEASAIWQRLTEREEEPAKVMRAIDSLINSDKGDAALAVTDRVLRERPDDWEMLYREAVVLAENKPQEAAARFRKILALDHDDDELGADAQAQRSRTARQPGGGSTRRTSLTAEAPQVQTRLQLAYQIRSATGLQVQSYYSAQPRLWTPDDFGQARMAALGWLLTLAEKDGKQDEFLAAQRQSRDKSEQSADAARQRRAQWDWYYLQAIRQDYPAMFEAGQALADGDDPSGQWVYLTALGNRTVTPNAPRSSDDADSVEPLGGDELDRMLAAYRSLRQKRPEFFAQAGYYGQLVVNNVTTELRRAKRTEEEQQIYNQALAQADQTVTIVSMLSFASQRDDAESVLTLISKLAKQPVDRRGAGVANYSSSVAGALTRLMDKQADAKQHAEIFKLYDRYWDYFLQQKRADARRRSGRRSNSNASSPYYTLTIASKSKRVHIAFPLPNDYFDAGGISLLRNAYELCKRDDLLSDLTAHLRAAADDQARGADRIYPRLALAYVHSWEESPREAVDEFARACELAPDDLGLKLDLAEMYETNGDLEEALAQADAVTPLDQTSMQRRELLALRVAVRSGNIERARQAAERLFGLRLDAEMQVELAAQMRQLGMHDLAEAVMSRARRQAGNRTGALVALMLQYQGQNKPDVAAQVAHQILRRAPLRQNSLNGGRTSEDVARSQAIAVLARMGKLNEMIARAEAQLKNSPHSVQMHQMLAEYYQAAGDRKKSVEIYQQMVAARPDDARLRYQTAQQLSQAGEPAAAVEHYLAAIKKEPRLFRNEYWRIEQTFRQAKKEDELIKLLEEIDLKSLGSYSTVTNLIQNMTRSADQRAQALKLFKLAWEAFPTQHAALLGRMYDNQFWNTPEAYDYARDALVPKTSAAPPDAWSGVTSVMSYSGDGRVNSLVTRFLDAAAQRNDLKPVATELETAVKTFPQWTGGKLLLALVHARSGQPDQARAAIEKLLADRRSPLPSYACWVAGQELENRGKLSDLAMKLYESTVDNSDVRLDYSYSPLKRLVGIYHEAGRDEDARALVLKLARSSNDDNYDVNYAAYQRIRTRLSIGQQLVELGYVADAAKTYNDVLADKESFELAQRFGGRNYQQQAEQGLAKATENLKSDDLRRAINSLLSPPEEAGHDQPAVDLLLMVQPRDLSQAELTSMLARVLKAAEASAELRAEAEAKAKVLVGDYPQDFSVQIAAALSALAVGQQDQIAAAIERLQKLTSETPLEELAEGVRPNSRQRAEAARQIGLWLVARECLKRDSLGDAADKLAERAMQAARRQLDPIYALAMLREQGETELKRGDRAAAERTWGEMLELVLPRSEEPEKTPDKADKPAQKLKRNARLGMRRRGAAAWRASLALFDGDEPVQLAFADAPAPPRRSTRAPSVHGAATGKSQGLPALGLEQFDQAMDIAALAAKNKLHALSLRAVREALQPGPPVLPLKAMQRGGTSQVIYASSSNRSGDQQAQISQRVEQRLSRLDAIWKQSEAPPADVYVALAEAVMPAGRPGEILLYAPALTVASLKDPTSAGKVLVDWAVRGGCVDRLRERVAQRSSQPLAQLPARVLLAQLAMETGDRQGAAKNLDWLRERIASETLESSAELACHAALPALADARLETKALGIVETAARNLSTRANQTSNDEPAASLLLLVARHQLRSGAVEAGRKSLQDYLAVCQQMNVRYSGDYGVYRRRQQLAKAATVFAEAHQLDDALDMLGQYADTPITSNYGQVDVSSAAVAVFQRLAAAPAAERYEKLKQWSLPTNQRKAVRLLAVFMPQSDLPGVFSRVGESASDEGQNRTRAKLPGAASQRAEAATDKLQRSQPDRAQVPPRASLSNAAHDVQSTLTMLVAAAHASGKLDELDRLAREAAGDPHQKIENAAALKVIVELAQGRTEQARASARALAKELSQSIPPKEDRSKPSRWADYLAANACAADPALENVGSEMLDSLITDAQRRQDSPMLAHLRIDAGRLAVQRRGGQRQDNVAQLVPWQPAVYLSAAARRSGVAKPWWIVDGNQAVHVGGAASDHLIFDYPLTGTFEVSAELLDGGWAEANFGYGGLCFEAFAYSKSATVYPVGRHEQLQRKLFSARRGAFNRYTLQVEPAGFRLLINGQQAYHETDPSSAAPWLALFTSRERRTAFRNLQIKGQPTIPRQVKLVQGDRLDGWLSDYYNESQPARIYRSDESNGQSGYYRFGNALRLQDFDWRADDGVLHGRRAPDLPPSASQSRLYYMRPLRDGETLAYEFFYEPGAVHVHPALDRLAFMIAPEGVALHWMTDGDSDTPELPTDNLAVEPADRRGPDRLPLEAGEWNAVQVRLTAGVVSLILNGEQIYRRRMETGNDRLFSFFHFKHRTAARVRNVVLSGEAWPETLSEARLANLFLPIEVEADVAPARLADAVLGEENAALATWQTWQTSRSLPAAERYAFLRDWVLPDPVHGSVVRFYGDFTPSDPAPPVAEAAGVAPPVAQGARRVPSGGELVVPALELVKVAAGLGKLDELRSQAKSLAGTDKFAARDKSALLALIAVAGGDDEQARQALATLYPEAKSAAKDEPEHRRWPALVVAWSAFERPALRPIAVAMLNQISDASRDSGAVWQRIARYVRGRAQLASMPDGNVPYYGALPPLTQWQTVSHATAASRGHGNPRAHWQHRPGGLMHYPGHEFDYAYFAAPLRGDFQVEAELSTFGWREMKTSYAALIFGILWDHKHYTLSDLERNRPNGPINPPLENLGQWYRYRLEVRDGQYTAFVNDRRIFSERLPEDPDPWLAFRTWDQYNGEIRQVRITGAPRVPDVLKLSSAPNLNSWLAEYYGESVTGDEAHWSKRGEEIFGRQQPNSSSLSQPSLLQYHRPMFEDGEIAYQFFYQPGHAAVAPALDRLTFLMEPSGVEIHWLTDGQYDRTGLAADNRTIEKENRRVHDKLPLKEGDWNQVRLTLKGDAITLQLNGVDVYQRALEPTNQRVFGLYHDAAHSEARVRNVTYRGDWPKSLPALAEQELAISPAERAALDAEKLTAQFAFDFRGEKPIPNELAPLPLNAKTFMTRSGAGATIVLPVGQKRPNAVGYETRFPLRGDFEIVAAYSALKTTPAPKAAGPGIDLHLRLASPDAADLLIERRHLPDGRQIAEAFFGFELPEKLGRTMSLSIDPVPSAAGKLKIVRKGPVAFYLIAERDSDDYRLLSEQPVGAADVLNARVHARAFSQDTGVEVVLEQLSIRAESFTARDKSP